MEMKQYVLGLALGIGVVLGANALTGYSPFVKHRIPQTKQVQQGYIAPSKLEVECRDLDGNGEPETIMRIGDRPLLVKRS